MGSGQETGVGAGNRDPAGGGRAVGGQSAGDRTVPGPLPGPRPFPCSFPLSWPCPCISGHLQAVTCKRSPASGHLQAATHAWLCMSISIDRRTSTNSFPMFACARRVVR